MLNSTAVDVVVGLILVYGLLGAACSVLNEYLQRIMDARARHLGRALQTLLADQDGALLTAVTSHVLIRASSHSRGARPSHLPSPAFAQALFDALVVRVDGEHPLTFKRLRDGVQQLPERSDVKTALVSLVGSAEGDLAALRTRVESWFDDAMDRLSGAYKRRVTIWILALGFIVAAATNADTVLLVHRFAHDHALRSAVAARAADLQADVEQLQPLDVMFWDTTRMTTAADAARHPLAMRQPEWSASWLGWLARKLVGLMLTALAISVTAPLCFDLLGRVVNLRATGARPAKTARRAEPSRA